MRNASIVAITLVLSASAIAFGGPLVLGVLNPTSATQAPAKTAQPATASSQSASQQPAPAQPTSIPAAAPAAAAPAEKPAGGFQAIPEGEFKPTTRTAIVVREVDFRDKNPVVFFRAQFVEVGQSLVFGKDAVTKGANRDGWTFSDENIDQTTKTAVELAKADAKGNIPNATVWLQLECASEQAKLAEERSIEVKDFGNMPFIMVTAGNADKVNDAFAKVCPIGSQQPAPAPAQPAPAQPAPSKPAPTQTPTVSGCEANTVLAFDAKDNAKVPTGWVVEEEVDNLRMVIHIRAKNVTSSPKSRIDGMTHWNYWACYGTAQSANRGAQSQAEERSSESKIKKSWNEDYQVFVHLAEVPAQPAPTQVPQGTK